MNPKKCQIYATEGADVAPLQRLLPGAPVRRQVWTLGFDIPLSNDEALQEVLNRHEKSIQAARRASSLQVLESTFTAQWAYGAFARPPDNLQEQRLIACVEQALAGKRRRSWNRALFWTVLYKGHRFIPRYVVFLQSINLLRTMLSCGDDKLQHDLEYVWHALSVNPPSPDATPDTPFHVLLKSLQDFGGRWETPSVIILPGPEGDEALDLRHGCYDSIKHWLREFCRRDTLIRMGRANWHIPTNIDYQVSRGMLTSKKLSFLERGILRTLLMGALHPEIQRDRVGADRIQCARCQLEADTAGHRFWRCPATRHLRDHLLPADIDATRLPEVLTRFGVATAGMSRALTQQIQRYMIAAVRATSVVTSTPPAYQHAV